MSAAYTELFLEQGTDFYTSITLDDVNGDPYDLTGVIAKMKNYSTDASRSSISSGVTFFTSVSI